MPHVATRRLQSSVFTVSYSELLRPNYKSMAADTTNYCDASGSIRESNMKIARCKQENKESKNVEPPRVLPLLPLLRLFCERTCEENIWARLKGADGRNENIL